MSVYGYVPGTKGMKWAVVLGLVVLTGLFLANTLRKTLVYGHGDARVYFRAAWAVRTDPANLYHVTDHHGYHYHYPPLFAILIAPLADAPPGAEALPGQLSYGVSVTVVYLLSLVCLAWAVHVLASSLEVHLRPAPDADRARRRAWLLRLWPVIYALPVIGSTLVRGQVNLILLLLSCGYLAGMLRGARFVAGLCLAGAICVKIIPAFLLLGPLVRRDGRCLSGCAVGLLIGLVGIPAATLGPRMTWQLYQTQAEVLFKPALLEGDDSSRSAELINATATRSQSIQVVLHKILHLGQAETPARPSRTVVVTHWLIGGLLTGWVLWRGRGASGVRLLAHESALMGVMLALSPVSHPHYAVLLIPAVMVVVGWCGQATRCQQVIVVSLLWAVCLAEVAVLLPGPLVVLASVGVQLLAGLALCLTGLELRWGKASLGDSAPGDPA